MLKSKIANNYYWILVQYRNPKTMRFNNIRTHCYCSYCGIVTKSLTMLCPSLSQPSDKAGAPTPIEIWGTAAWLYLSPSQIGRLCWVRSRSREVVTVTVSCLQREGKWLGSDRSGIQSVLGCWRRKTVEGKTQSYCIVQHIHRVRSNIFGTLHKDEHKTDIFLCHAV